MPDTCDGALLLIWWPYMSRGDISMTAIMDVQRTDTDTVQVRLHLRIIAWNFESMSATPDSSARP
jgi:hypothetical protein